MEPDPFVTGSITAMAVFTGVSVGLLLNLLNDKAPIGPKRYFRVTFLALAVFIGLATVSIGLRQADLKIPAIAEIVN